MEVEVTDDEENGRSANIKRQQQQQSPSKKVKMDEDKLLEESEYEIQLNDSFIQNEEAVLNAIDDDDDNDDDVDHNNDGTSELILNDVTSFDEPMNTVANTTNADNEVNNHSADGSQFERIELIANDNDDIEMKIMEKPPPPPPPTPPQARSSPIKNGVTDLKGTSIEDIEMPKDSDEDNDDKITGCKGDPEAESISDDELPGVQVAKVPETEEVSDEELPGPKRAELPADIEVVSEDELLPTTKKDGEYEKTGVKRKLSESGYDPTSPTSETEMTANVKKPKEEKDEKDRESCDGTTTKSKVKKLPELDKYWKAVNDDPTDFTGWTYLLQYVDQENDMEAAREAYDAFLSHYPYCYGYWRKYADYEKRKGNKKKCEEVFERGLKAIPLSVDLWIHYLQYVKASRGEDEDYVRSQFERALTACGLEFRSDRLWESYIKWETDGKRLQNVTNLYDRLLLTPTQNYTTHFDNFQEHVGAHGPNKILDVDEFMALRKEVRNMLKTEEKAADNADLPPGDEDSKLLYTTEDETKCIRERIVSIRRKIHKNTVNAVTARWNFEEGIKRPYFHVKPLERCQLKNWQDYLDYEIEQGDQTRIVVLFERCLIACALYEEFWLKYVHYLENLNDESLQARVRDVYERACTIHHLKKPNLHLRWAVFEEVSNNVNRAAEILVNLEKQVPNVLQVAYRRINLERRKGDFERCIQLFEHYINNSKNKLISSNIAIKYSRFCLRVLKDYSKSRQILEGAIVKDPNNPRLYLQLIDLILQKDADGEQEQICNIMNDFLEKDGADADQKVLFAQRKLEYLEDFGASVETVQAAHDQFHKYYKLSKELGKKNKDNNKSGDITVAASGKKDKTATSSTSQSQSYGSYAYGNSSSGQPYSYSGSQQGQYSYPQYGQGDQYQYQNWQYSQSGAAYSGYNQWSGYTGSYGY
ncbi:hypothetical protein ABEB36_006183 [Hypothenemus hampei]|uniref:Pre-mRNA-processing factor 39 n=1 Tax=Hypothenemus hampei TaxID=57062 RepID=A0ABD1EPN4_HYPHA